MLPSNIRDVCIQYGLAWATHTANPANKEKHVQYAYTEQCLETTIRQFVRDEMKRITREKLEKREANKEGGKTKARADDAPLPEYQICAVKDCKSLVQDHAYRVRYPGLCQPHAIHAARATGAADPALIKGDEGTAYTYTCAACKKWEDDCLCQVVPNALARTRA